MGELDPLQRPAHGIDLGDDGATANDAGDGDSGPNHLQNYPSNITFATRGDVVSVRFSLDATAAERPYIVDFYSCDSSTSGEGEQWLGFSVAVPSGTGVRTFNASTLLGQLNDFTAPDSTATHITATATDRDTDSTSEFAPCVARVDLPELVISQTEIGVDEGGTDTYTVRLTANPTAETTVTLSSSNTAEATVSDAALTFTTTTGTTAQTVTVTGVDDSDADNEGAEIRHLVSIGGNEFLTAVLPMEVTDDDAPMLTFASTDAAATFPSDVSVGSILDGGFGADEANRFNEGDTATYTIALTAEPSEEVTIDLESSWEDKLTVSPTSITFTKDGEASDPDKYEWDDLQTVTLTAVSDSDGGDEIESVYHRTTVSGKDYVLGRVGAIIHDSNLPGLTYSPDTREVTIG